MHKVLLGVVLSFFLSLPSQARISIEQEDLEKVIQQLDWEMTREGTRGQHYRNRVVRKLTCIAQLGKTYEERVFHTAGRLLGHENEKVRDAAWQIFRNLSAEFEAYRFSQKFLLRSRHLQHYDDMMDVLEYLVDNKQEGLEIIHEFYPTMGEASRLNQLVDLFFQRTGRVLKIRLRVFTLNEPTSMEWTAIYSIKGEVIQDFHLDKVDTDFICPVKEE